MSFLIRRSLPSLTGLLALLLAVGVAAVIFAGAPVWIPPVLAIVIIGLQYAIGPFIVQWLVPATLIDHDGTRYLTDDPIGDIVARRCRDAGVPLVRLGIVDDGTPNAFTFGHTPKDARMWLTRGLFERLDERELDAVVTHEVGHVKHWDFVVMTVAAVVPMVCYFVYVMLRRNRHGAPVAIAAYIAYWVAQITLLSLSRAREYAADHWSCECTGNGDALASALVKIAYGMGEIRASEQARIALLVQGSKSDKREAHRLKNRQARLGGMRVMGILDARVAAALTDAAADGVDGERAIAAMRWDVANPWGATLEKLCTHPLVARRIEALAASGLPGAPTRYAVLRDAATSPELRRALRSRFAHELFVALAPWVVFIGAFGFGIGVRSVAATGVALLLAGGLFWWKQLVRYPLNGYRPVPEVTELLTEIEAGPVAGIPVEVRGRIIGRGMPGYVLSPDLVVQDESGFVPLLYTNPLPFGRAFFGLASAKLWLGREVVARGWYRRTPGPLIELRSVRHLHGPERARGWQWITADTCAAGLVIVGLIVMAVGLAG